METPAIQDAKIPGFVEVEEPQDSIEVPEPAPNPRHSSRKAEVSFEQKPTSVSPQEQMPGMKDPALEEPQGELLGLVGQEPEEPTEELPVENTPEIGDGLEEDPVEKPETAKDKKDLVQRIVLKMYELMGKIKVMQLSDLDHVAAGKSTHHLERAAHWLVQACDAGRKASTETPEDGTPFDKAQFFS